MEVADLDCGLGVLGEIVETLDPQPFLQFLTLPECR